MKISLDHVRRVAALAALEFGEADLEKTARDMSDVLDYVDRLAAADVSDVPDGSEPAPSIGRDDVVRCSEIDAAGNAPSMIHGHFVVPKVIGGA